MCVCVSVSALKAGQAVLSMRMDAVSAKAHNIMSMFVSDTTESTQNNHRANKTCRAAHRGAGSLVTYMLALTSNPIRLLRLVAQWSGQ